MDDPLSLCTFVACCAICVRLLTYRRRESRFRPGVSLCAYLLAFCTGAQALSIGLRVYPVGEPSLWMLGVLLILLVLVFRARGNLARILYLG